MEVPRIWVESELQVLAYARGTATQDLSHVYDLHHSSRQCQILNPLSEARDQTHNLMVPSQIPKEPWQELPIGLFLLLLPSLTAYGSFQARGRIGAATAGHNHSNARSEPCLQPTQQLKAMPDP